MCFAFPLETFEWHKNSNNVVVLQARDEEQLVELYDTVKKPKVIFAEPDLDNAITAIATLDGKPLSNLPLLLRQ